MDERVTTFELKRNRHQHVADGDRVSTREVSTQILCRKGAQVQNGNAAEGEPSTAAEITKLLGKVGGRQEDRTPDLRIANAALSQLS